MQRGLSDAARPGVVESCVDRAIELPPEARADWRDVGPLRNRQLLAAVGADDDDETVEATASQTAQKAAQVCGDDLELTHRFDFDNLDPLNLERARIVGLELEAAPGQTHDFSGDPVAIRQRDNVG